MKFLQEEILKALFELESSKEKTKFKKKQKKNTTWSEFLVINYMWQLENKSKGTKVCHNNKNKYINTNKSNQGWQDRLGEKQVSKHSHMHSDNKWPSWQSNSSQSLNIFLIPNLCLCIFYFTSENKWPHFGLTLK